MARRGIAVRRLPVGYDGRRKLAPDLMESPYQRGDYDVVVKNIGESTLAMLYAAKSIDEAQLQAGDWFRKTYEKTRMGSMAVDPSREPVDTSGRSDPIPDRMIAANQKLALVRAELGCEGYRAVEKVCGEGWHINDLPEFKTARNIDRYGFLLKLSLDTLAAWLGLASKKT